MEDRNNAYHLQELDGSDYKIAENQPDIDGWSIYDERHQKVGKVHDMLFDPQSQKVRYIIANLKNNELNLDSRTVLVPIGIAQLHEQDDDVILSGVTAEQLRALPEYRKDGLTKFDEAAVLGVFSGSKSLEYSDDFYQHQHFSDENFYRRDNTGSTSGMRLRNRDLNVGAGRDYLDEPLRKQDNERL